MGEFMKKLITNVIAALRPPLFPRGLGTTNDIFCKRCFGFIFAPGHMVTTEWLNVYCKDAVKIIQNILPWQGQPPQKAASSFLWWGVGILLLSTRFINVEPLRGSSAAQDG